MSAPTIRLPRLLEADPLSPRILQLLVDHAQPLRQGSEIMVASVKLGEGLVRALRSANTSGMAARGLESAEEQLELEERGLILADKKQGVTRGGRISRLLILSGDGSDRFYRRVENLLRRHTPRVLAVRLKADAATLGGILYGPGRMVKLLMIEHKAAVSTVLLAMAMQDEGA